MGSQPSIDEQVDKAKDKIEDTILDFESLIGELSGKEKARLKQLKGLRDADTLHSVAEQIVVIRSHMSKVRGHINTLQLTSTKLDDVKIQGILVQNMDSVTSILQEIEILTSAGSVKETINVYQTSMRNMERDQIKVDRSLRQGTPSLGVATEDLVQQVLIENNVQDRLNAPIIPSATPPANVSITSTATTTAPTLAPIVYAAPMPSTGTTGPDEITDLHARLTALRTPGKSQQ